MSDQLLYMIGHREVSDVGVWDRMNGIEPYEHLIDYHKIGIAKNPERRLSSLQGGTPHKLELLTTVECDDARAVEDRLHQMYYASRKSGEWFRLDQNTINSLKALDSLEAENVKRIQRDGFSPYEGHGSLYLAIMEVRDNE